MAKTKVSEIAKKLAAVKPDSIVLKNKEPRPVMRMNKIVISRCQLMNVCDSGEGGAWRET